MEKKLSRQVSKLIFQEEYQKAKKILEPLVNEEDPEALGHLGHILISEGNLEVGMEVLYLGAELGDPVSKALCTFMETEEEDFGPKGMMEDTVQDYFDDNDPDATFLVIDFVNRYGYGILDIDDYGMNENLWYTLITQEYAKPNDGIVRELFINMALAIVLYYGIGCQKDIDAAYDCLNYALTHEEAYESEYDTLDKLLAQIAKEISERDSQD